MRKKLTALVGVAVVAVALSPSPASAGAQVGLAVPGSAFTGYATPVVVVAKAAPFTFVNTDVTQPHNIQSVDTLPDGRPLFSSAVIGAGQTAPVQGMQNTVSGKTYEFFCKPHPGSMRGTLVVI